MKTITQFKSIESFSTERLIFLKIEASDLDKFITMHTNPQVMETLGGIPVSEKIMEDFNWHINHWKENGFGLWMVYLKESKIWIGDGGL